MFNTEMCLAIAMVLIVFAVGDFFSTITKAKISSLFVIMVAFLLLFLFDIYPDNIIDISGLKNVAMVCVQLLLLNMGTTVSLKQLAREWRTVVASCLSMAIAVAACIILIPVVGKDTAIVSAPVITGGIAAVLIMQQAAEAKGMVMASAVGAFVYSLQKFFGTVPASSCGLKAAKRIVEKMRQEKLNPPAGQSTVAETTHKKTFYEKHEKYYTTFTCLAIGGVGCFISSLLGDVTGISGSIWSMVIGIALGASGLVCPNFLRSRANSAGFFNFMALVPVIPSLATIEFHMLPSIGFQVVLIFAVTIAATYIVFKLTPAWRIIGDKDISIGVAMCQMIGYPGTQLIVDEIANAVGTTQEERDMIQSKIATAYVISGFASVTILSVFIAGFMAKLL